MTVLQRQLDNLEKYWLSRFGQREGWDRVPGAGSTPTFSAWASRDFRLLVTVFNSSSSSEHLLVFYKKNAEERRQVNTRRRKEKRTRGRMDRGTSGDQGMEDKTQRPKINLKAGVNGKGSPKPPLTQQECATSLRNSTQNQTVRSKLQHSCLVRRAWNCECRDFKGKTDPKIILMSFQTWITSLEEKRKCLEQHKFHFELNYIFYVWGKTKRAMKKKPTYSNFKLFLIVLFRTVPCISEWWFLHCSYTEKMCRKQEKRCARVWPGTWGQEAEEVIRVCDPNDLRAVPVLLMLLMTYSFGPTLWALLVIFGRVC